MFECVRMTPFGLPVDPDENIIARGVVDGSVFSGTGIKWPFNGVFRIRDNGVTSFPHLVLLSLSLSLSMRTICY